jgi:hypothetical protein
MITTTDREKIVRMLREYLEDQPFVITMVSMDMVDGKLQGRIIVDGHADNLFLLELMLKESPKVIEKFLNEKRG